MRPHSPASIPGITARVAWYTPSRFTAMTSRQKFSSLLAIARLAGLPALLTRMWISPAAARASSSARPTCSGSVTSAVTVVAPPGMERAVSASCVAVRASSVTRAPSAASARAIAAPMPRPAPVINACLPARACVMPRSSDRARHLRRALEVALELALRREILLRPPLLLPMLLRRRAQRPGRVREVRPGERAEVRAPRGDDRVDVIGLEDVADRDRRDPDDVAHQVRERRLPHASVHRFLPGHGLAAREVEQVGAAGLHRARD